jgi:D-aminopeptidase
LNNARAQRITAEHALAALEAAHGGEVEEGNVGGGTGMICHGYKGGIGTASRRTSDYTVGVLVQANHGRQKRLRINGTPIPPGSAIERDGRGGSIIGIVATDAPLLPHQCDRLAQRAGFGVARMGGLGENSSGDFFLAFATGNRSFDEVRMLPNEQMDPLFEAVVDATEEAILNALLAARTMTGRDGHTIEAIDVELVRRTVTRS